MKLHELSDNPGATKKRKRVGRGPGSGMGKTAGRGIKGQSSRSGVAINGYEGGQMAIHRRMPKRGFNPIYRLQFAVINLQTLERALERGAITKEGVIDEDALLAGGVIRRRLDGVRLLAKGELTTPLTIEVAGASAAAIAAVEKIGGKVEVIDVLTKRRGVDRAFRDAAKA